MDHVHCVPPTGVCRYSSLFFAVARLQSSWPLRRQEVLYDDDYSNCGPEEEDLYENERDSSIRGGEVGGRERGEVGGRGGEGRGGGRG